MSCLLTRLPAPLSEAWRLPRLHPAELTATTTSVGLRLSVAESAFGVPVSVSLKSVVMPSLGAKLIRLPWVWDKRDFQRIFPTGWS